MRSKTLILLLLALGCGLVASIGISQILQRQDQTPAGDLAPVWVVMTDIKRSDLLTMQNLKLEQWPKEKIPPGALSKLEEVDGKRAKVALYAGEAVLDKKILGKDQQDFSNEVPPGFRLFTVTADGVSSHGGLLHPDDRVDVLLYVAKGTGIATTGTKTILEDILVFAVNDQVRTQDDKASESITAKTVTLLVTPSQAEKLALANEIGKIKLVMRGPSDKGSSSPNGTTLQDILITDKSDRDSEEMNHPPVNPKTGLIAVLNQSQAPAAQEARPEPVAPQETFTMQVIRGTEMSELEFKKKMNDPTRWDNGSSTSIGNPPASTPEAEQPMPENANPAPEKTGASKTPGAADAKPAAPNQGASQAGGHS
jgi:pilus assembly protein CpaB